MYKRQLLYRAIQADKLGSIIFYGPPGTGKTTLAKVIANTTSAQFKQINACLLYTSGGNVPSGNDFSKRKYFQFYQQADYGGNPFGGCRSGIWKADSQCC